MEYLDIINRIIEAEQRATQVAQQANDAYAKAIDGIEVEIEQLKEQYQTRAQRRVGIAQEQEDTFTAEIIADLEQKKQQRLAVMQSDFEKNRQDYVNLLFHRIVHS